LVWLAAWLLQSCQKADTITAQAQLHLDTVAIRNFLTNNSIQAVKVNTGFWYSIDTVGLGVFPVLSDSVTLSYTARKIPSLEEVDNVTSKTFLLSGVISGLQQGLILFPAGSYGKFYLPSGLAFGVNPHNDNKIKPNSNLLYEVKLISVKGIRLTADIAAIDSYLQSHSIVAKHDTLSGIRYSLAIDSTVTNPPKPSLPNDFITVTYTERILNADTLITSVSTPVKIALKDQIAAWRIMLPKYLSEGSTMTIYTPSGYAYGSSVKGSLPANSNMVYVVNLIKVN